MAKVNSIVGLIALRIDLPDESILPAKKHLYSRTVEVTITLLEVSNEQSTVVHSCVGIVLLHVCASGCHRSGSPMGGVFVYRYKRFCRGVLSKRPEWHRLPP